MATENLNTYPAFLHPFLHLLFIFPIASSLQDKNSVSPCWISYYDFQILGSPPVLTWSAYQCLLHVGFKWKERQRETMFRRGCRLIKNLHCTFLLHSWGWQERVSWRSALRCHPRWSSCTHSAKGSKKGIFILSRVRWPEPLKKLAMISLNIFRRLLWIGIYTIGIINIRELEWNKM